jgi:hypothetical protein
MAGRNPATTEFPCTLSGIRTEGEPALQMRALRRP